MNPKLILLGALALISHTAYASEWHIYSDAEYKAMACKAGIETVATWCETSKKYKCACKNQAELGSWINCLYSETSVNNTEIENEVISLCATSNVTITSKKIRASYQNATNYLVDVTKDESFNKSSPIDYPIVVSKKVHKAYAGYYIGYSNRYGNITTSHYLGIASISMWAGLLVVAAFCHWIGRLFPSVKKALKFNTLRKYLTLAPTFKKLHLEKAENAAAHGSIPLRFESFIIAIHLIFTLIANLLLGYSYHEGDKVFKTRQAGVSRYYGDRAAVVLSYQIPLLFLFAGRNNFLQWMTGWSYSRFVTFHKWLARTVAIEVIIHTGAFVSQSAALGKTYTRLQTDWYRQGIAATVACMVIVPLASYIVRKRAYEFFLVAHIVLAVMFLWTAYKHAGSQEYTQFYWACCGVWAFDRVVRVVRILLFGVRTAKCTFLVEEGTIKLTIPYPASYWKPYPGAHGFVHFLLPSTFWQSHPFTFIESVSEKDHVHLYCKVKGGITKVLLNKFANSEGSTVDIKVLVEGPYGEQSPYHHYDKAILMAGGNGIAGPFAHAAKLATSDVKTEIKLYWQVREYSVLNWFGEELSQLKNTNVHPIIYVSNPNSSIQEVSSNNLSSSTDHSDSSSTDAKESHNEKTATTDSSISQKFDFIEFRSGRMNVSEVVSQEINEAKGTIAFGACAHPSMVDDIRVAVKNNLSSHNKRIDYFEEMQSW